jgi:bacteriocin biosynthesis cyclodehydratase domain-containing protein
VARRLPTKPKIHSFFDVIFMEDHACQLRAGDDRILILRGRTVSEVFPHLLPHLDGTRTLSDLVHACKDIATEDELIAILERLNEEGIIEDAALAPPSTLTSREQTYYASQLLFFSHFTEDRYAYQAKLHDSHVIVIGLGTIGTAVLIALARSGVGHITGVENNISSCLTTAGSATDADISGLMPTALASVLEAKNPGVHFKSINTTLYSVEDITGIATAKDVVVLALDKPRAGVHELVNQVCLKERIPWMTCGSLRSMATIVGPFFVPYETCCYTCYDRRMKSNLEAYHEYMAYEKYLQENEGSLSDYGYLPGFATVTGDLMAVEIIKHLTQCVVPETYGAALCFNFLTLQTELHEALKLPRCPSCGPAAHTPPRAVWSR